MSAPAIGHGFASVSRVRSTLTLAAGDKAIYPGVGPCLIGRVEKRIVDAMVVMFYHLVVLDGSRGELFIPVEKARAIGVRSLMKKSEIPKLLAHLQEGAKAADNWKQRAHDNSKLFTTGSPFDLAEIVGSLTELSDTRSLTVGDSGTLGKARRLLICEISEVTGEKKETAEEQLDQALNAKARIGLTRSPRGEFEKNRGTKTTVAASRSTTRIHLGLNQSSTQEDNVEKTFVSHYELVQR